MNIRTGIATFLKARRAESPWLIGRWTPDLETQINVRDGIGEGEGEVWANHRWPYNATAAPQYSDKVLTFDPGKRCTRIGSTWWNWRTRESVAIGFDIDAEDSGHAAGTNQLDSFKLGQVVAKLSELDYVTLVRSTGGKGVHGYVFFNEKPKTANHNEHTQVGLAVIQKISEDTGLDMGKIVDVKGVVLWFWSESSPAGHPGFSLIKEASRDLNASEIPHTKTTVCNNKNSYEQHALEPEHISILSDLEDLPFAYSWLDGHNMARTHTVALKMLMVQRESEGNPIKGVFETVSSGSDPTNPNCYIVPRPNGVFKVTRYGNGAAEHRLWSVKDDSASCLYNHDDDEITKYVKLQGYVTREAVEAVIRSLREETRC